MNQTILEQNAPIKSGDIAQFERRRGIRLPPEYKEFLLRNNGGRPTSAVFAIDGLPDNPYDEIQIFFGLGDLIKSYDLDAILLDLAGLIPTNVLPIACTGGDDFVCLDLRSQGAPVVYWDRRPFWGTDTWNEHDIYPIAPSFGAFLNSLWDDTTHG